MSKTVSVPFNAGVGIGAVVSYAAQTLQTQGLEVQASVMSPQSATMVVTKDNDGFQKIIGLGIECSVTLNVMGGNQLVATIESNWTNQILALSIGWFFCLVPFITGLIGCANQSSLPDKISAAIQAGVASAANPGNPSQPMG